MSVGLSWFEFADNISLSSFFWAGHNDLYLGFFYHFMFFIERI